MKAISPLRNKPQKKCLRGHYGFITRIMFIFFLNDRTPDSQNTEALLHPILPSIHSMNVSTGEGGLFVLAHHLCSHWLHLQIFVGSGDLKRGSSSSSSNSLIPPFNQESHLKVQRCNALWSGTVKLAGTRSLWMHPAHAATINDPSLCPLHAFL